MFEDRGGNRPPFTPVCSRNAMEFLGDPCIAIHRQVLHLSADRNNYSRLLIMLPVSGRPLAPDEMFYISHSCFSGGIFTTVRKADWGKKLGNLHGSFFSTGCLIEECLMNRNSLLYCGKFPGRKKPYAFTRPDQYQCNETG